MTFGLGGLGEALQVKRRSASSSLHPASSAFTASETQKWKERGWIDGYMDELTDRWMDYSLSSKSFHFYSSYLIF